MIEIHHFTADQEDHGLRLDLAIIRHVPGLSRSQLKTRLLRICLGKREVKISWPVEAGQSFALELEVPAVPDLQPQDISLDLIHEDQHCAVINKPPGLVVHPGAGNPDGTVVNALLYRYPELRGLAQENPEKEESEGAEEDEEAPGHNLTILRPGIVHRLDKDTSGVLITARSPESLAWLSRQFQERLTRKWYLALAWGAPEWDQQRVQGCICRDPAKRQSFMWHESKGKPADSVFYVLARQGRQVLFLVRPHTGRTHQIRVHARHLGCPLVGDPLYGRNTGLDQKFRLMLHALALEITLPGHGEASLFFAPPPKDLVAAAAELGLQDGLEALGPEVLSAMAD